MLIMDLTKLPEETKRDLARYLSLSSKLRKESALDYWTPWVCKHGGKHASQLDAFKSTARRRLALGGNREVAYGTKIRMADGSVKVVEDIKIGDEVLAWDGKNSLPTKVVDIPFDGKTECIEYVTIGGKTIQVGITHCFPMYLSQRHKDNKKPYKACLKDVQEFLWDQKQFISSGIAEFKCSRPPFSGLLMGLYLGDGSSAGERSTGFRINFTNTDQYYLSLWKDEVGKFYPDLNCHLRPSDSFRYYVSGTTKGSNGFQKDLESLGLLGKICNEKFIPDRFKYGDIQTRKDVLSGLICTDGGIDKYKTTIWSTSLRMLEDVKDILNSLGFDSKIYLDHVPENENQKPRYKIQFSNIIVNSLELRYLGRKTPREMRTGTSRRDLILKEVRPLGVQKTRCITIEHESHCFVLANGIVTYNSGKTNLGSADVSHAVLGTHPYRENRVPCNIKVVGEDFPNHINNVLLPGILSVLPKRYIKKLHKNSQGYVSKITIYNESSLDFMSYEQEPSKFESFAADGAWFDEPPPKKIYEAVLRGLLDREGFELFTMTPIKEPWVYNDIWVPAMEGNLSDTDVFVLMSECNPYLKQSAIDKLKEIYSEDVQDARLRGQFSHLSGLVYKNFRRDTHVVKYFDWPKDWPVWMSIDPHPKKPHAVSWVGVTNKNQLVVLDELKAGVTIAELAKLILSKEAKMGYRVVDRLIDTSIRALDRTDQRDLLANAGIRCRFAKKHDNVMPSIQLVNQLTTPVKRAGQEDWIDLVVRENCRGHILEFLSYVWADSEVARPNKDFDDYMDNIRYIASVGPKFNHKNQAINYMRGTGTYGHRQ